MAKFLMTELVPSRAPLTARLGAGTGAANQITDKEVGKAVKLVGDSRYDLCAAGDNIEGFINSLEPATLDDYSLGSVQVGDRKEVTADGLEVSAGTGTIAVGDYVNMGTAVAKDTALTVPNKVTKATTQANVSGSPFAWRVVSLGSAGTGAVGTDILIEKTY